MLDQGKSVRSPPPEEERAAETMCDEQTTTPIPHPPAPLRREEVENSGVKLSLGRNEAWGEGVFKICFYFSLSYSDLIGNKLVFFPQVESVLPVTVIAE